MAEHIEWFLTDVLLFTHLVHLPAAYASKNISYEYTLCVVSMILAKGYIHRTQFGEHLKVIWCVIAAIADMVSVEMMTNLSLLK